MKYFRKSYFVKYCFVAIFALQFASGHNLVAEALRLPSLIEHLKEHRLENPNISIVTFLYLHYADQNHEHSDSRHERLPLHCHHVLIAETLVYQHFTLFFEKENANIQYLESTPLFGKTLFRFNDPIFGFFRPPQLLS
jgi:hypothetical protein